MQESIYSLGWAYRGQPERKSEMETICDDAFDEWDEWWDSLSEEERRAENFKSAVAEEVTRITCKPTQTEREEFQKYLEESRPSHYWQVATARIKGDLRLKEWDIIKEDEEMGTCLVATVRDGITYLAVGQHIFGVLMAIDLDSLSTDEYYY